MVNITEESSYDSLRKSIDNIDNVKEISLLRIINLLKENGAVKSINIDDALEKEDV